VWTLEELCDDDSADDWALRYMQTLLDMGSNQNATIVFPLPIELIRPFLAAPTSLEKPLPAHAPVPVNGATTGALVVVGVAPVNGTAPITR